MLQKLRGVWTLLCRGPRSLGAIFVTLFIAALLGLFGFALIKYEPPLPAATPPLVSSEENVSNVLNPDRVLTDPKTGAKYAEFIVSKNFDPPNSWMCLSQADTTNLRCLVPVTDEVINTAERSDHEKDTQTIVIQESKSTDTVGWTNIVISAVMTLWTIFAQRSHVVALARWTHRQGRRGAGASRRLIRVLRPRP